MEFGEPKYENFHSKPCNWNVCRMFLITASTCATRCDLTTWRKTSWSSLVQLGPELLFIASTNANFFLTIRPQAAVYKISFEHEIFPSRKIKLKLSAKRQPFCSDLNKSLRLNDAIWRHRSGPNLAQVMACCPTAPSHYLNDDLSSNVLCTWHSPRINFTRSVVPWAQRLHF